MSEEIPKNPPPHEGAPQEKKEEDLNAEIIRQVNELTEEISKKGINKVMADAAVGTEDVAEATKLEQELETAANRDKLGRKMVQGVKNFARSFGIGGVAALGTRIAIRDGMMFALGGATGAGIAGGAAAGAVVEGGRTYLREQKSITAQTLFETIEQYKNDPLKRSAALTQAKELHKKGMIKGNKEELGKVADNLRFLEGMSILSKKKDGDFEKLPEKDKLLAVLQIAQGERKKIPKDQRKDAEKLIKDLRMERAKIDWHAVRKAALRGAIYGGIGAAATAAIMDQIGSLWGSAHEAGTHAASASHGVSTPHPTPTPHAAVTPHGAEIAHPSPSEVAPAPHATPSPAHLESPTSHATPAIPEHGTVIIPPPGEAGAHGVAHIASPETGGTPIIPPSGEMVHGAAHIAGPEAVVTSEAAASHVVDEAGKRAQEAALVEAKKQLLQQHFIETIGKGEGFTQGSREAVHDFLVNLKETDPTVFQQISHDPNLVAKLVYTEDAIAKQFASLPHGMLHPGVEVQVSGHDILNALNGTDKLTPEQLHHLAAMVADNHGKDYLSAKTLKGMLDFNHLDNSANNFYGKLLENMKNVVAYARHATEEKIKEEMHAAAVAHAASASPAHAAVPTHGGPTPEATITPHATSTPGATPSPDHLGTPAPHEAATIPGHGASASHATPHGAEMTHPSSHAPEVHPVAPDDADISGAAVAEILGAIVVGGGGTLYGGYKLIERMEKKLEEKEAAAQKVAEEQAAKEKEDQEKAAEEARLQEEERKRKDEEKKRAEIAKQKEKIPESYRALFKDMEPSDWVTVAFEGGEIGFGELENPKDPKSWKKSWGLIPGEKIIIESFDEEGLNLLSSNKKHKGKILWSFIRGMKKLRFEKAQSH